MKENVAIFTDLHMGLKQDSNVWHEIALDWCDWFVKKLDDNGIEDVIFMGDFFHNRTTINVNTLFYVNELLNKLKNKNLHFILGNHDLYYNNNFEVSAVKLFDSFDNLTLYSKPTIITTEWQKLLFCGWGYNPLEQNEADTLFTHAEINVFQQNDSHSGSGLKATQLSKKFSNIFSGHYHHRQFKTYKNCHIQYTGNPFAMDFSDRNTNKGFDIYNLRTREIKFIVNDVSPKFVQRHLSDFILQDIKLLKKEIHNSFYKLIIDKNITLSDINELTKLINICQPKSLLTEWENGQNFHQDVENINGKTFDTEESIKEYISMLDIDMDMKEKISIYLLELYKKFV